MGRCQTKHCRWSQTFSAYARLAALLTPHRCKRRKFLDRMPLPDISVDKSVCSTSDITDRSESSEENEFDGVIQVDFEFFDVKPNDFHALKILLSSYIDIEEWDLSGFVDLITEQSSVGTVIKIEGEEDGLFSIVSALNLGKYREHRCIRELGEFLLKVSVEERKEDLRSLLGEQALDVGLLVSHHVINLPLQVLPPLYDFLFGEVSCAAQEEPTEELRNLSCFKIYLLVSKMHKLKVTHKKKWHLTHGDESIIYTKPEDEIFHKLSSWSFSFPLNSKWLKTNELRDYCPTGLVMVFDADKISAFREQLRSLCDD